MGVNKLNSLMKECAAAAGIGENKRITNHSGRKTLTQTLLNHDVPPTQIIQVTGHKNLQSVNNYGAMGERQQENVRFSRLRLPPVQPSPWSLVKLASFLQLRARQQPA